MPFVDAIELLGSHHPPVAAHDPLQLAVGAYAFGLDDERRGPLVAGLLQQFVYRQLMYLVVIQSVMSAAAGTRLRWHKLVRTGGIVAQVPAA